MKRKKIFVRFFAFINAFLLVLQLIAMGSISGIISIPIFSLVVPLLCFVNIFFFIFWLIRFQWPFLLFVLTFVIGFKEWRLLYQFKDKGIIISDGLSVMSYNVRSFNRFKWLDTSNIPKEINTFITNESPDIISFQEYAIDLAPIFKDYPYLFFTPYTRNGKVGSCIISKLPLYNPQPVLFTGSENGGMYVDFLYKKDTLRLYNIHFESLGFNLKDTLVDSHYSKEIRSKINKVFAIQQLQVLQVKKIMNGSVFPEIICTDLNNNAFSASYRALSKGMKDSFLAKGAGFGSTYQFPYFPLRIDYILTDPKMKTISFKTHSIKLSDHKPISVSLEWP
jgi:vancomycin resistance protein VanJ